MGGAVEQKLQNDKDVQDKSLQEDEVDAQLIQGSNDPMVPRTPHNVLEPSKQPIRSHIATENGKQQLHFHDDSAGIKVAVPVADWYSAWQKLSTLRTTEWQYLDIENNTLLTVKTGKDRHNRIEARIDIEKTELGTVFSKLSEYTRKV